MKTFNHPIMADVADNAVSPKVAAAIGRNVGLEITKNDVRAIFRLRVTRAQTQRFTDPLVVAKSTRATRTKSKVAESERQAAEREAAYRTSFERLRRQADKRAATRKSLLRAARVARKMGYAVRASKGREGRVSSYYCSGDKVFLRISDHEIPWTPERESRNEHRGGFDGFHGAEIIIEGDRREVWLRRAILLAANGRSVTYY